jgi:hypothetical protein
MVEALSFAGRLFRQMWLDALVTGPSFPGSAGPVSRYFLRNRNESPLTRFRDGRPSRAQSALPSVTAGSCGFAARASGLARLWRACRK